MDHRDDWLPFEAFEDLDTMVEVLQDAVRKDESEKIALDQETRWPLEDVVEWTRAREEAQGRPFSRRDACGSAGPPGLRPARKPTAPKTGNAPLATGNRRGGCPPTLWPPGSRHAAHGA
jgi:hypothetical protein